MEENITRYPRLDKRTLLEQETLLILDGGRRGLSLVLGKETDATKTAVGTIHVIKEVVYDILARWPVLKNAQLSRSTLHLLKAQNKQQKGEGGKEKYRKNVLRAVYSAGKKNRRLENKTGTN